MAENDSKTMAHQIGGLQNDALRFGLQGVKSEIVGQHPLQSLTESARRKEEETKRMILSNTYGSALPLKMDLDRQILSRTSTSLIMARTKRTFIAVDPPTAHPVHQELPNPSPSHTEECLSPPIQTSPKRFKTTAMHPAYIKEPVLPTFDFTARIEMLPSPIHRAIATGDLERPPKHGREYDWEQWLKSIAHHQTISQKPLAREDTPPPSRPKKKTRRNKAQEFRDKIKEHNRKKLHNSWDSTRVIEGVIKFDNPYKRGIVMIPISLHRHQSMLNGEPSDHLDGERLAYTESWLFREPRLLEGILQPTKPRQQIGDIHSMIFLTPSYDPHSLYPACFYETLQMRFRDRQLIWSPEEFRTRGLLTPRNYYSEWAGAILAKHAGSLSKIDIFNAIEATSHPFYKESSVLKAFLDYWCPSTNSFHFPEGEMSITLWDVHRITGLPLTGKFFDEFVPTNDELAFVSAPDRIASISETTAELFKEMSKFPNIHKIHPMQWLAHFSRTLRFNSNHSPELERRRRDMKDRAEYSVDGELAAFIAYWLSIVVFPSSKSADAIRPSLFVVAGAMAEGIKYSLAPPVLCSIYRGFGEIASHIKSPSVGSASTYMPWHYFLGWLGVYFPWTFEVPEKAYVHPSHIPLWFFQKRAMAKRSYDWAKDDISSNAKINYFQFCLPRYTTDTDKADTESLTTGERAFFLSIRSCSLPLREGTEFWREPYYPSRFARQFGFDQAVPEDCGLVTRRMRSYGTGPFNWVMIWKQLLGRANSSFIIPGCNRIPRASYNHMRWWVHQSYLVNKGLPVAKPIWLPPPRLRGHTIEEGVGFIAETSHAPFAGHHCVKISVDEPIREKKPDNTLEGWIAYGIIREFEKVPLHHSRREEAMKVVSPVPKDAANLQDQPTSSTHLQRQSTSFHAPRIVHPSPSSPMTRSRTRAQASPQEGTIASASPVLASTTPQPESNQSLLSKGKQVVIEESSEEDSESESSTSSSGNIVSDEHEVEEEIQDDNYKEGEVDISGEEDITAKDVSANEGHILPTYEAVPAKTSPIAGEEEDEPLDYGEYGYSPCDHVANTEADNTSPISLPPVVPAALPRFSLPPRAVAREIAFPVEPIDLPTPTTIDSSTEAKTPSFAEMVEPNPPSVKETQPLAVPVPAEGNLPQSGTTSSGSIGTSSNVLSLEKISAYKLVLIRNSILAIVEMFKVLAVALDVLDSAARMAKVNVSSVRDALLRFHNSITVLSSAETAIVPPEILEYKKQLAYSKEKVSQIAPIVSRHDQEQLSLQEQLKTFIDNKANIQNRITLLKQEITQLEKQDLEEDLNIERVQEKIQCSFHSVDAERSELAKSEELIASLEEKLACIPDPTRNISNARLGHAAAQVNLQENLQQYLAALGITGEL